MPLGTCATERKTRWQMPVMAPKPAMKSAMDSVDSEVDAGRRTWQAGQEQAQALADEAQQKAKIMADDARNTIARLLDEQPILLAALAAALGAAVGAAMPMSKVEKDLVGPTGARALDAGREALSGAAAVLRQEASSADLGNKVGALADKVIQSVAKEPATNG